MENEFLIKKPINQEKSEANHSFKIFIHNEKKLTTIPLLISISFMLISIGIIYEFFYISIMEDNKIVFPEFHKINDFIKIITPLTKMFIVINQLLIFMFCFYLLNTLSIKDYLYYQSQQLKNSSSSTSNSLLSSLSLSTTKQNSTSNSNSAISYSYSYSSNNHIRTIYFISCFLSCTSLIILSTGILDDSYFYNNKLESEDLSKRYYSFEKTMVHIYIISTYIYYITLTYILSENFNFFKSIRLSPILGTILMLTLFFIIFYLSYITDLFISDVMHMTNKFIKEYRQVITFCIDSCFIAFFIFSQTVNYFIKGFFNGLNDESDYDHLS